MEKYTTISRIADRIMRHPLLSDTSFESIIDYTIDFIQLVGCPQMFEEKTAILEVSKYRAKLPCDYVSMILNIIIDTILLDILLILFIILKQNLQ